jgi:hypothetical protein
VFAAAYIAGVIVIGMRRIGYGLLADKNSAYPFAPDEMERFDRRGHLARLGRVTAAVANGSAA